VCKLEPQLFEIVYSEDAEEPDSSNQHSTMTRNDHVVRLVDYYYTVIHKLTEQMYAQTHCCSFRTREKHCM